jgi:four helix bundle protein
LAVGNKQSAKNINMTFKDLTVFKKAFDLAMQIFEVSKSFPKEETYSLTDQIRRSSRSVCACIGESYRKRIYPAHFVSKTSDADMENSETQVWLLFALKCNYITQLQHDHFESLSLEVGKLLAHMMQNPESYTTKI